VEALTNQMEEEAFAIIEKIDDMEGCLRLLKKVFPKGRLRIRPITTKNRSMKTKRPWWG